MDIVKIVREFGVKLATGQTCSPGVLINVNSDGEGRTADNSTPIRPHGAALTSGAGTKVTGLAQYVNCLRSCTLYNADETYTPGAVAYATDDGQVSTTAPGTTDHKVGFALDANTVFIDLDSSQYT